MSSKSPPHRVAFFVEEYLFNVNKVLDNNLICLPSGHSVLALPVNVMVTALILTLLVMLSCNLPRRMADELECESRVVPSWSNPVRYITGSARTIEHDTPFPAQIGFSVSAAFFIGIKVAAVKLFGREFRPFWAFTIATLDILDADLLGTAEVGGRVVTGADGTDTKELRFDNGNEVSDVVVGTIELELDSGDGVPDSVGTRGIWFDKGEGVCEGVDIRDVRFDSGDVVSEGVEMREFLVDKGEGVSDGVRINESRFDLLISTLADDRVELEGEEEEPLDVTE